MRAKEFIAEEKEGKLHPEQKAVMPTARRVRDNGGYDRTNHLNRMMMALAMHDGKTKNAIPKDQMDPNSWVEKYNTAHPYTREEDNMVVGAMKTLGADHHHVISDHRSREPEGTHKTSPVRAFKGYGR
jgi:hypothetical protein